MDVRELVKGAVYRVPARLAANHIRDTAERLDAVREAAERHYFTDVRYSKANPTPGYLREMQDHVIGRLKADRMRVIPWLDSVLSLRGVRILELGCGTGASTVALAEQGAVVTSIDIESSSIEVAQARCTAYGLTPRFIVGNATDVLASLPQSTFPLILFFACLEHMTNAERIESLRLAWAALPSGGLLAIIDTPNRLWYNDTHTSLMPFYHWLPDDLALEYSRFTPREIFNTSYSDKVADMEQFLRRGRGVSFHELDVAIQRRDVHSSLLQHHRLASLLRTSRRDRQHTRLLMSAWPGLHSAWCVESLDLVLKKP